MRTDTKAADRQERIKLIYLMGMGRSGGTLLGRLLGQQQSSIYVGELRYLWQRGLVEDWQCACGSAFSNCNFWSTVLSYSPHSQVPLSSRSLLEKTDSLNRSRWYPYILFFSLIHRWTGFIPERLREFASANGELYRAICAASGVTTVVESSRYPGRAMALAFSPDVDVYVIHLVRDARGVICSQLKQSKKRGQRVKRYPARRVVHWSVINLMSSLSALIFPSAKFKLQRYESFASSPIPAMKQLMDFCGMNDVQDSASATGKYELQPVHIFSANDNRFEQGTIDIKPDTAWRDSLAAPTRQFISLLTGLQMKCYGYRKHST